MKTKTSIGESLYPILKEVEDTLWEFDANFSEKPNYPTDAIKSATKIFSSVIFDKVWELQEKEGIQMTDRLAMVQKCGEDIRQLIKTYTAIDSHDFYK